MAKQVQVRFINANGAFTSQEYTYNVPKHLQSAVEKATHAVVDSPQGGLVVVKIVDYRPDLKGTRRILSVFDMEVEKALQLEDRKRWEAKQLLDKKLKEFNEKKAYQIMAESDPEVARLLSILEE